MKRNQYPSDLTEQEWLLLKDLVPPAKFGGRPRTVEIREILNAVFRSCEQAVRGVWCRTIFRNGQPFIIIGASGGSTVCGNESTKLCAAAYEKRQVEMRSQVLQ